MTEDLPENVNIIVNVTDDSPSINIMQIAMDELKRRNVLKHEVYAPYFICSYAVHFFNLMNQRRRIYWEAGEIPNLRLHIIFVAPAGYMKSFFMKQMGGGEYSLLRTWDEEANPEGANMVYAQNLNEAGLCGTWIKSGEYMERKYGLAEEHKESFVMVDEFKGITDALKSNGQLDTQLLAALDHGHIAKRMAGGEIKFDTNFTMWGGVQPGRYDLEGGMGRRMLFLVNVPDQDLKHNLRHAQFRSKGVRSMPEHMAEIHAVLDEWRKSLDIIETITYDESTIDLYDKYDVEPYDTSYFDRLILGYYLATKGPQKDIVLKVGDDPELMSLIEQEIGWRRAVAYGPDLIQVINIIKSFGKKTDKVYAIEYGSFVKACTGVSMNIIRANEKLKELSEMGIIAQSKSFITMEESYCT